MASLTVGCMGQVTPSPKTPTPADRTEVKPTLIPTASTPTQFPIVMVNPEGNCRKDFEAGVAILMYGNDPDTNSLVPLLLERLAYLCVNAYNITFPYFQDNYQAVEVKRGESTPRDEKICTTIQEGKKRGFLVTVRPSMDEASLIPTGHWRGSISPKNVSAWFDSYRTLIWSYADLANRCGADIVSIGFELNSMEKYTEEWSVLIQGLRERFKGKITYAGNWVIREQVKFWDYLDFISIDQFAPVQAPVGASIEQLTASWKNQEYFQALRNAHNEGKRVVLAEIGATAQTGSHLRPYIWDNNTPVNLEAQRRYYAAACAVYSDEVDGMYWWAFELYAPNNPSTDGGFNPMGKPAEEEVKRCYQARP